MSVAIAMVVVVAHASIQLAVTIVPVVLVILFKMEKLVKVCDRCFNEIILCIKSRKQ